MSPARIRRLSVGARAVRRRGKRYYNAVSSEPGRS